MSLLSRIFHCPLWLFRKVHIGCGGLVAGVEQGERILERRRNVGRGVGKYDSVVWMVQLEMWCQFGHRTRSSQFRFCSHAANSNVTRVHSSIELNLLSADVCIVLSGFLLRNLEDPQQWFAQSNQPPNWWTGYPRQIVLSAKEVSWLALESPLQEAGA